MKVLVVDDSGVMRKIVIRALNGIGVENTLEAGDGREGWEVFQAEKPDLVLTDWNMPEMNGLEFLQTIRKSGSKVPVVMITTESEKSRVIEAIQAGVNDYLCKPFEQETLREKMKRFAPV